jgi:hypothetical protein
VSNAIVAVPPAANVTSNWSARKPVTLDATFGVEAGDRGGQPSAGVGAVPSVTEPD